MQCRVKDGKELTHGADGAQRVFTGGEVVDLDPLIAYDVRHLVDAVDPTGKLTPIGAQAETDLQSSLERAQPHERISLLEQARDRTSADLALIDKLLAEERAKEKAAARKSASTAPAKPAVETAAPKA